MTPKEPKRHVAKIDDTTAFGCSHSDHSKHRVYVDGLDYEEAKMFEKLFNDTIDRVEPELKPCPFCGGKAVLHNPAPNKTWVTCTECCCETMLYVFKDTAINAWNNRK